MDLDCGGKQMAEAPTRNGKAIGLWKFDGGRRGRMIWMYIYVRASEREIHSACDASKLRTY